MSTERPNNVITLAPYRLARQASQRPYVMWYPNVGFVASAPTASASIRPLLRADHRQQPAPNSIAK